MFPAAAPGPSEHVVASTGDSICNLNARARGDTRAMCVTRTNMPALCGALVHVFSKLNCPTRDVGAKQSRTTQYKDPGREGRPGLSERAVREGADTIVLTLAFFDPGRVWAAGERSRAGVRLGS